MRRKLCREKRRKTPCSPIRRRALLWLKHGSAAGHDYRFNGLNHNTGKSLRTQRNTLCRGFAHQTERGRTGGAIEGPVRHQNLMEYTARVAKAVRAAISAAAYENNFDPLVALKPVLAGSPPHRRTETRKRRLDAFEAGNIKTLLDEASKCAQSSKQRHGTRERHCQNAMKTEQPNKAAMRMLQFGMPGRHSADWDKRKRSVRRQKRSLSYRTCTQLLWILHIASQLLHLRNSLLNTLARPLKACANQPQVLQAYARITYSSLFQGVTATV